MPRPQLFVYESLLFVRKQRMTRRTHKPQVTGGFNDNDDDKNVGGGDDDKDNDNGNNGE